MTTNYVLGDVLGIGGIGRVYDAQLANNPARHVAVKILDDRYADDPEMRHRLLEEACAGRCVAHHNVVRTLDHGALSDGTPFIIMERIPGIPLGDLIRQEGPLPRCRIRTIATQILDGLAAIHGAGLVHGDMKSDNVLVESSELDDRATIIDFGLARLAMTSAASLFGEGMSCGTPDYMAPEACRGEPIGPAADLYGVATMIYEMFSGATPFGGGDSKAVMRRQLHDKVVPLAVRCPDRVLPNGLDELLAQALSKRSQDRPVDAKHFAATLALLLGGDEPRRSRPFATRRELQTIKRATIVRLRDRLVLDQADGDFDGFAATCLDLVRSLVGSHRMPIAARVLETSIEWLDAEDVGGQRRWHLALTLAGLYGGIGEYEKALALALAVRASAVGVGLERNWERADALVHRLDNAFRRAP